jgi:hypothetical protein
MEVISMQMGLHLLLQAFSFLPQYKIIGLVIKKLKFFLNHLALFLLYPYPIKQLEVLVLK